MEVISNLAKRRSPEGRSPGVSLRIRLKRMRSLIKPALSKAEGSDLSVQNYLGKVQGGLCSP
jgi:hypothetical protein